MRIGAQEVIIILVIALIVFGPQRLPEIARQIGSAVREVRKVSRDFQREVKTSLALEEDDYGGNFPKWTGPPRPPMEQAEPYKPPGEAAVERAGPAERSRDETGTEASTAEERAETERPGTGEND